MLVTKILILIHISNVASVALPLRVGRKTKANAYDNGDIGSFSGTLKCETIYLQKVNTLSDLFELLINIFFGIIITELTNFRGGAANNLDIKLMYLLNYRKNYRLK